MANFVDKALIERIKAWKWDKISNAGLRLTLLTFVSYTLASTLSLIVLSLILDEYTKNTRVSRGESGNISLSLTNLPNYHSLRKAVLDRNIFNSEGTFPDESEEVDANDNSPSTFNAQAPCVDTKLKLKLVGTIVLRKDSVASIMEQGYSQADVYRLGDVIIGNEGAQVYAIERNRVIINNSGTKECIEVKFDTSKSSSYTSAPVAGDLEPPLPSDTPTPPPEESGGEENFRTVSLEASFVESQLGDGGGKLVNDARLVPQVVNGEVEGFKIFAIKPNSLFSRVGLKNGDIVLKVNDTSLKQADQGFALFQAFQEDREIMVNFKRGGQPNSLQIRIK